MNPNSNPNQPLIPANTLLLRPQLQSFLSAGYSDSSPNTITLRPFQKQVLQSIYNNYPRNLMICKPTASGKTLDLEMMALQFMHEVARRDGKDFKDTEYKVVYVAPFKALCQQKLRQFTRHFTKQRCGHTITTYYLSSQNKYTPTDPTYIQQLEMSQLIICTPQMFTCLLKQDLKLGLVLFDELHLIDDPSRGQNMEVVIGRVLMMQRERRGDIRIGFASATVNQVSRTDIAKWTGAEVKYSEERVIPLQFLEGDFYSNNKKIFQRKIQANKTILKKITDIQQKITRNPQQNNNQPNNQPKQSSYLIFCGQKKDTQDSCKSLYHQIIQNRNKNQNWCLHAEPTPQQQQLLTELLANVKNQKLKVYLREGIAYHHAGMRRGEREAVERLAQKKCSWVKVIFCTTTLAFGINLPVKVVIINQPIKFFQKNQDGNTVFHYYTKIQLNQMIGRAGRFQGQQAYFLFFGGKSYWQKLHGQIRGFAGTTNPSFTLQTIQSKIMKNPVHAIVFQLGSKNIEFDQEGLRYLRDYFKNSLYWYQQRRSGRTQQFLYQQINTRLQRLKGKFQEYRINKQCIGILFLRGISAISHKEILDKLKDTVKRIKQSHRLQYSGSPVIRQDQSQIQSRQQPTNQFQNNDQQNVQPQVQPYQTQDFNQTQNNPQALKPYLDFLSTLHKADTSGQHQFLHTCLQTLQLRRRYRYSRQDSLSETNKKVSPFFQFKQYNKKNTNGLGKDHIKRLNTVNKAVLCVQMVMSGEWFGFDFDGNYHVREQCLDIVWEFRGVVCQLLPYMFKAGFTNIKSVKNFFWAEVYKKYFELADERYKMNSININTNQNAIQPNEQNQADRYNKIQQKISQYNSHHNIPKCWYLILQNQLQFQHRTNNTTFNPTNLETKTSLTTKSQQLTQISTRFFNTRRTFPHLVQFFLQRQQSEVTDGKRGDFRVVKQCLGQYRVDCEYREVERCYVFKHPRRYVGKYIQYHCFRVKEGYLRGDYDTEGEDQIYQCRHRVSKKNDYGLQVGGKNQRYYVVVNLTTLIGLDVVIELTGGKAITHRYTDIQLNQLINQQFNKSKTPKSNKKPPKKHEKTDSNNQSYSKPIKTPGRYQQNRNNMKDQQQQQFQKIETKGRNGQKKVKIQTNSGVQKNNNFNKDAGLLKNKKGQDNVSRNKNIKENKSEQKVSKGKDVKKKNK